LETRSKNVRVRRVSVTEATTNAALDSEVFGLDGWQTMSVKSLWWI